LEESTRKDTYGLEAEAGKYKPSSSRSFDGISPSEYENMGTAISKMSAENMEQWAVED